MKFYRSQEYYDNGKWRGTWKMDGGGAVMNQGIHGIDLLQYVMGPVNSIFAYSKTLARKIEVEDTAAAVIEFKNNALGTITATTSVYPGFSRRMEICGTKGAVILEEDRIVYYQVENEQYQNFVEIQKPSNGPANDPSAISIQGHITQISDVVNAILNNRKPLIDAYEGRKSIEIISAIYQSNQYRKPITFPLDNH
jgi:UDP-N-acetyl-2-amino-2-deoxyglucuronate dehydrogenase